MIKLSLLICVLCCYISYATQATEPTWIFESVTAPGRQFPGLDQMSNGTLILGYGSAGKGPTVDLKACMSHDHGATWSAPFAITTVNNAMLGLQRRPRLMIDKSGTIHVVFEDYRNGSMTRAYYSCSTDNGTSWSTPSWVVPGVKANIEDFVSAALDSSGNVLVTFLSSGLDQSDPMTHVYLVKTSDNGVSWTDPVRVDNNPEGAACECCQQTIDVSPNGDVVVAYRANINNRRDIHVAISNNGGKSFGQPILIQAEPWFIDGCPSQGPSVRYDGLGNIHVAWMDSRQSRNAPIVYYSRLQYGKASTPLNIDLSSELSSTATYPSVSASSDGMSVIVAWESSAGIFQAVSTDSGSTFSKQLLDGMTVHNGNVTALWKKDGEAQVVWQANRDGLFDIRTNRGVTSSVGEPKQPSTNVWCSSDGLIHVSSDIAIQSIVATDLLGRDVTLRPISGKALYRADAVGIVIVCIQTAGGRSSHMIVR